MDQKISFVETVANKINQLGLTGPAILLLEAHKPLAFISSQFLLVAQPTVDIFLPPNLTRNMANLLADADQLEALMTNLEAKNASDPTSTELRL